jgi:N-acetylglucosamine-6-phosphate deacetylase
MKAIDIHTHGIGGYDTTNCSEQDILNMAQIQRKSGVSGIVLALYPSTIRDMRHTMAVIKNAVGFQKSSAEKCQNIPDAMHSEIIGVHLEGPFLNKNKCGSLNPNNFLEPSEYSLNKLIEGFVDIIKIITISPELKGASQVIKKAADMGIIVSMGHSEATYVEAENGFKAGAKGVTHIFNGMRGFHHREPGIAGFALTNRQIYTEVIADPHHLHPATLEMLFRVKNTEKIIIISDSVKETGLKSSGEPITEISGFLKGGSMTIIESAKRLAEMGFDNELIIKCIMENPQRYLNGGVDL